MTERLEIKIEGALPEAGKYAILAKAEESVKAFVAALAEEYKMELTMSVKAIRPGVKKGVAVAATVAASEAPTQSAHGRRHDAAE